MQFTPPCASVSHVEKLCECKQRTIINIDFGNECTYEECNQCHKIFCTNSNCDKCSQNKISYEDAVSNLRKINGWINKP